MDTTLLPLFELFSRPRGCVALLPTETVYGLFCRADDAAAQEKIYQIKGRDHGKPLQRLYRDGAMLRRDVPQLPESAEKLMRAFMPGPLMLIVPSKGEATLGFRIPDHAVMQKVLTQLGIPLCGTSANGSGLPNVRTTEEALRELCAPPDFVYDAGVLPENALASTLVNCCTNPVQILRVGAISPDEIMNALNG